MTLVEKDEGQEYGIGTMLFSKIRCFKHFILPSFCLTLFFLVGCTTVPEVPKKDEKEQAIAESRISQKLAHNFEKGRIFVKAPLVENYFSNLAQALVLASPALKGPVARVKIFREKSQKHWRNYGLPGNRLYLSLELLRVYEFENEFAAMLALELGHLEGKRVLDPVDGQVKEDVLDRFGISETTLETEVTALRNAIGILYRAGYDSRGLITLYQKMEKNSGKVFLAKAWISQLIEESRRGIAASSPLRNPIVQSLKFVEIHGRIQSL